MTDARKAVAEEEVKRIIDAPDVDDHEAAEIGSKYDRTVDESAILDRHAIRNFFGWVDEELARKDRNGALRERVREYEHAKMELDGLLLVDLGIDQQHPTEYDGATLRASVMTAFCREVLDAEIGISVEVEDLPARAFAFWRRHRLAVRRAFPRGSSPSVATAGKWARQRLDGCGAVVRRQGERYIVTWLPDHLGRRYRDQVYSALDRLSAA